MRRESLGIILIAFVEVEPRKGSGTANKAFGPKLRELDPNLK